MRTAEEVLACLESELEETNRELERWRFDETELMKHRVKANTLEHLIDEISLKIEADPENEKVNAVKCEPTEILTSTPKEKITFLDVYVNAFAFVLFFTSLFFIGGMLDRLLGLFELTQGFAGSLISYGYYVIHIISFAVFSMNADRTFTTKIGNRF